MIRVWILFLCLVCAGCTGPGGMMTDPSAAKDADESNLNHYRLEPGDQINIQVYREPQLSGMFRIDASGFIHHPLCGSFQAAGLTIDEVESRLEQQLGEKYLVNPKVIVSILEARGSNVVILGEVKNPGVHPVPFGESITLLQAIAEAGGFTDLASVNRVTVTRTVDGKEKSIRARVSRMISGKEPDMVLKSNDVIMVPEVVF